MRINTINRFQTSDDITADINDILADIECTEDCASYAKEKLLTIEKRAIVNQGRLSPKDAKARKNFRAELTATSNRLQYLNEVMEEAIQVRDTRKKGAWLIQRAAKPVQPVTEPVTTAMVAPIVNRKATPKPLPFLGRSFNLTDPEMTFDRKAATFTVKMAWAKRAKALAKA